MKKQILFLTFFIAAILAGMNSYGQVLPYIIEPTAAPTCIPPSALLGCTADQLHPVQAADYTYTVTTTAATDVVRWFVVDNTAMELAGDALIDATLGILAAGNGAIDDASGNDPYILSHVTAATVTYDGAGAAASTNASITLQWKYFDGVNNEILLVAYVETAPDCTNNIAVMRIIPQPAFTIDVVSVLEDGSNPAGPTDTPNEECVSPIESASYTSAVATTPDQTNEVLTVDYGENWVFFVVNGANYFDSWTPEIQLTYVDGSGGSGATPTTYEASWAYIGDATSDTPANWHAFAGGDLAGGSWTSAAPVIAGGSAATDGTTTNVGDGNVPDAAGECIVVRVRLDWGTDIEHDQDPATLTFAANGIAYDGTDFTNRAQFEDLKNNGIVGTDCLADGFDNDVVNYFITPRPQVEEGVPQHELKTGQGVN